MTGTRAFRLWSDRIEAGTFTKSLCNQFAAAVATRAGHGRPLGKSTSLTTEEAERLWDALHASPVSLTPDHETQGLGWLRKYGAKVLGLPPEAVNTAHHFSYAGDQIQGRPVWRCHLTDGRVFEYFNVAWVSAEWLTGDEVRGWWWAKSDSE